MIGRSPQGGERGGARLIAVALAGFAAAALAATLTVVHAGGPAGTALDPMTITGQRAMHSGIGRKHTPSTVIFPEQTMPLRFSHKVHLAQDLDCVECHQTIRDSVRASDVNLPTEATCLDCHDIEEGMTAAGSDPPAACSTCHLGFTPEWLPGADKTDTSQVKVHPPKVVIPTPHLNFNHKLHLSAGVGCDTCHKMKDVALATRENALPTMETCIGCHDGKTASRKCGTCHVTNPDGRIDTTLDGKELKPAGWYFNDAHDADWLYNHRTAAQTDSAGCDSCHTQKDCMDCHNGVKKPLKVHPNNWILQHPIAARKNTPDCTSCHRTQTFCVDCHQSTRVAGDRTPAVNRPEPTIRFHPEGWVENVVGDAIAPVKRGSNHHSFQAQRNIQACASCHTERSCLRCHSTFGAFGARAPSPHPPGFPACESMKSRNQRVCAKCHTRDSPQFNCR